MFHTASASTVEVEPASFRDEARTPSSVVPDLLNVGSSQAALEGYIRFFLNEISKSDASLGVTGARGKA
ncbi:MAG: hypothetical protein P4L83_12905 [Nevskia sp.]|nr:hypothetical protein [Nevskia sp.]